MSNAAMGVIERLKALSKVGFGYDLKPEDREALTAAVAALSASPAGVVKPQCCMCGKKGLSTVEGDGGTECELTDGRWVCSAECWDKAVDPVSTSEAQVRVKALEWDDKSDGLSTAQTDFVSCYSVWSSEDHWVCSLIDGTFLSRELAKAAAQADYERRIRSAITTEPAAPEGRQEPVACECTKIEQLERENAELNRAIDEARKVIELVSTPVERIPISRIAYNAGIEIRHAIANSGVDPIQHIPEVDAIIERRLIETRREALEEAATAIAAKDAELAAVRANRPDAHGWLFNNPDTGIEWLDQHPIESGEVPDAENVRPASAEEVVTLLREAWNALAAERAAREKAEAALAEARKALGMMLKEHDILSGNFGDVMDPKHKRPDRWPTAAEAARRALEGGEANG